MKDENRGQRRERERRPELVFHPKSGKEVKVEEDKIAFLRSRKSSTTFKKEGNFEKWHFVQNGRKLRV